MKTRENSGHILRILVLALVILLALGTAGIWADDEEPGNLPNSLSKDGIAVRPGFAVNAQPLPISATAKYKPATSHASYLSSNLANGIIIVAGVGCVGFLLWRNHQIDKKARRWKKRQSKWRLF